MTQTSFTIDALTFDAASYASEASAVLGIRGAGKTYTATLIAERLAECGVPFVAFDPIGVWRYLRTPGEGRRGRGLPVVVAGGEASDLALTPESAPAIVEAAMREGVSLVIDLFHIDLAKADWRRIVLACVKLLIHRNKPHGLRHVFLEEAAEFAPQIVTGEHAKVYSAIEQLVRMGGNSGLGLTLVNQRAEQVNKAVLELCDNLFLHRQKGRNSITALSKWLDAGGLSKAEAKEITATLTTLAPGEAWGWPAGAERPTRIKIPQKRSHHPDRKAGRADAAAKARAPIDVSGFVEHLKAALPEIEAENAAKDPARLQAEIAALKKQLVTAKAGDLAGKTLGDLARIEDEAERRGFMRGCSETKIREMDALRRIKASALSLSRCRVDEIADSIGGHCSSIDREIEKLQDEPIPSPPTIRKSLPLPAAKPIAAHTSQPGNAGTQTAVNGAAPALSSPQQKVLTALAWWSRMGHDAPTKAQLAAMIGWAVKGSNLRGRLAELSTAGMITYPQTGRVALTQAGATAAPAPDMAATVQDSVRAALTNPQQMVFDALIDRGAAMTKQDLGQAVGWEPGGSNLRGRLAELSAREIITYPERGAVALQDWVTQ